MTLVLTLARTDILFTLQQGGQPLFHRNRMAEMRAILLSRGFTLKSNPDVKNPQIPQLNKTLKEAFLDLLGVCNLFNKHIDKKPLDVIEFQEILVSVCYRLMGFRTLNEARLIHDIDSAYHIGLLVFLMSTFWNNHQSRLAKPGLIAACIRDALYMADGELAFWLLMLGGISIPKGDDQEWMLTRLREEASRIGVVTWKDARDCLARFPWMTVIHDESGQRLWDKVRSVDMELSNGVMTGL